MKRPLIYVIPIMLLVAGVWGLREAGSASSRADREAAQASHVEISAMHGRLSRVVLDELNTIVQAHLGDVSPTAVFAASARRTDAVASLQRQLLDLDEESSSGRELGERLDGAQGLDAQSTDLTVFGDVATWPGANASALTSAEGLVVVGLTPQLALNRALDVEIANSGVVAPPGAASYWNAADDRIAASWAIMGPTPSSPTAPAASSAFTVYPRDLGTMSDALLDSGLYGYHQWITAERSGATTAAPMSFGRLLATAGEQDVAFATRVDRAAADARLDHALSAQQARGTAALARFAGIAAIVLGVLVTVGLTLVAVRQGRREAEAGITDPLTGAGNRRHLDMVGATLDDPGYQHHLIGLIDLDRFKLVNDVYGHEAGDAVLVALVERLRSTLGSWQRHGQRSSHVLRMAGDEFVVSLHSDTSISSNIMASTLRTVIEQPLPVPGVGEVPILISVGLVPCRDSEALTEALSAANLAVYEDRQRRQREWSTVTGAPLRL